MKQVMIVVGAGVLVLALVFGVFFQPQATVQAAPQAAPTPVSVTRPAGDGVQVIEVWDAEVIAADTTATCVDIGTASVLDAQYQIDQTDVNTVTLTTQWSINGELITDGVDVVASNAADASEMVQVQAFGRYICPKADVSNTNAVTVTLYLVAK